MNFRSYWRLAAVVAITCAGLLAGGCSGDDDDNGGGGSAGFAPPPTARPTLAGLTVRLDASGGGATGGSGGSGGEIIVWVQNGQLINGSGPGRAGIDNNIISQASMTGGTVTMTELFTDAGVAYSNNGAGTAFIDLFGWDFFVPAGVTLDLSDAVVGTIDTLVITTHMPNDFIRIDGTILLARTGDAGVNLELISGSTSGLGISVDGMINGDGDAGEIGSIVSLDALHGSIAIGGAISSRGGSGTLAGSGGIVLIQGRRNHVWLAQGTFEANGGQGSSNGGNGGNIDTIVGDGAQVQSFNWGIRANGGRGLGGFGGTSGRVRFFLHSDTHYFSYVQANGGQGSAAGGGSVNWTVLVDGGTAMGVLQVEANGGLGGTGTGGEGGRMDIYPAVMQSFALVMEANGGDSTSGAGGSASSSINTYTYYGDGNQVLLDITANGGDGTSGGNGGGHDHFFYYGAANNVTMRFTANGGDGSAGSGGNAGLQDVECYSTVNNLVVDVIANGGVGMGGTGGAGGELDYYFSADARNAVYNIVANGGQGSTNGEDAESVSIVGAYDLVNFTINYEGNGGQGGIGIGGDGGDLQVEAADEGYGGKTQQVVINAVANGGNSTSGSGGSGGVVEVDQGYYFSMGTVTVNAQLNGGNGTNGGAGGYFGAYADDSAMDVTMNITANGGSGTTVGGSGGELSTDDDDESFIFRGSFIGRGGMGLGTATGGFGGFADDIFARGYISFLEFRNVMFDLRGGDSEQGNGGQGGGFDVRADGVIVAVGLNVDVSGGTGGTVSGTGNGGQGGTMRIETDNADLLMSNSTMRANGGNGTGNGGNAGDITLRCDSAFTGRGGFLSVNATVTVNGGNSTVAGDGGDAGDVNMVPYAFSTSNRVGEAEYRGSYSSNGGNGAGAASTGGTGGFIGLLGGLQFLHSWATLSATGGTGTTGGEGGDVEWVVDEGGELVIGGNVNTNGGVGSTTGGPGGSVYGSYWTTTGPSITVLSGVLIQANGGGPDASAAGNIDLDSGGVGVVTTGATLQTNDGTGVAVPANINIS